MAGNPYFSIALFFVLLREALEVGIVVSVLISFVNRLTFLPKTVCVLYKRYVWLGTAVSFGLVLAVGGVVIALWYIYGKNVMESSELLYEGIFGLLSSVFIAITGLAFLKGQSLYEKLNRKLELQVNLAMQDDASSNDTPEAASSSTDILAVVLPPKFDDSNSPTDLISVQKLHTPELNDDNDTETDLIPVVDEETSHEVQKSNVPSKFIFFTIPFLTVLREGLETVLLVGGVSFGEPGSSIPLAAITGIIVGSLISYGIHRAAGRLSLRWFFALSSYILFLMAAGIFSRSVGKFEDHVWSVSIGGADIKDAPSFDPRVNVWFLPSMNENFHSGYGVLNALLGYRFVASIWTILAYCGFWMVLSAFLVFWKYRQPTIVQNNIE